MASLPRIHDVLFDVASLFLFSPPSPSLPLPQQKQQLQLPGVSSTFHKSQYLLYFCSIFFFGILLLLARSCSRLCRLGIVWRFVCIVIDTLSLVRRALQYHCRPTRRIRNAHDTARMAHCALRIAPHRSAEI